MSLSKERQYILYLLSKQDYSRKQLTDKLYKRANISNQEIEDLLNDFENRKWLSDERFIHSFIQSEVAKLRGKKRIVNTAIYQKGLSAELVEEYLNTLEINWFDQCQKCLNKKYKNVPKLQKDLKLKQKAINYLVYNGFNFDEINGALAFL
ncbi:regulatory protein RecX [Pseudofrancisella aestuarii]|uniref:Regulatory protein RecX n=1 Tax=Pseudofrancisella aestuarii TaxID=2670347 RepID=A0ABV9TDD2_9GAMM|nr:regulatory protein RecX [Pseudofrancisella aestuarii]